MRNFAVLTTALFACAAHGCRSAPSTVELHPQAQQHASARDSESAARRLPPADSTTSRPRTVNDVRTVAHQQELPAPAADALFAGSATVNQLVAYAVANNPEIGAARAKAEAMISRVPQARSFDDPMLSATVFIEEIQTAAGPQEVMLSLSQKFPWFGKRNARGEMAFHEAQAAYAELANVELAVVEQLKLAYYDLSFIDQALGVYRELEPKLKDVIEIVRTRFETNAEKVGLETVYQAEVALHKLQITVAELEQARLKAAARLAKSLHLPRGMRNDIQPQLDQSPVPRNVDLLVAMLDQCHPQLEARRQAIVRDDWSVALAEKNYYPDATFGFNWNEIGSRGLSPIANGDDAFSLMVGINLPVYKAKRDAALREARLQTVHSAQQFDAAWDALRADVERLHAQAVEHDRVLRILNDSILRKAQQTFDLSVEAYRVDRIGFQQLVDNYENLLRFRLDFYLRTTSREQAIAQLERAVGCTIAQWPGELEIVPVEPLVPRDH